MWRFGPPPAEKFSFSSPPIPPVRIPDPPLDEKPGAPRVEVLL